MKCEAEDCTNDAKYALFDKYKRWLNVCPGHEQVKGDENMRRYRDGQVSK